MINKKVAAIVFIFSFVAFVAAVLASFVNLTNH
jgi:hypothetical protein